MTKRLKMPMVLPMIIGVLIISLSMGCNPKKTAEQNEVEKALLAKNAELKAQLAELEASQNQQPKDGSNQEETAKAIDMESLFALSAAKTMDFNRVKTIPFPFDHQDDLEQLKYGFTMGYMDKIDVIGWSKKGLLAYRYISDGGGRGGFLYLFEIVDTVNDTIIVHDDFNDLDVAEEHERNAYRDKWNSLLEKNGITGKVTNPCSTIDENKTTEFPLGAYECWFDYSARDGEYGSPVYSWRLIVGNNAVQKVVTRQVTDEASLKRIRLLGYYKSPFENRIAILLSSGSGFSGNVYFEPKVYGCNMSVGLD